MYEIDEVAFADVKRALDYKQNDVFGAKFNLKGFNYPWIIQARSWSKGERVLDVGPAYSKLPIHIADAYGCEVWCADDFGIKSGEQFWERGSDPDKHIRAYPQIHYVLERLGNPEESSLPENYFDCIFSASALEHVPETEVKSVWEHMDHLLKPGGEMIHGLDFRTPTARGLLSISKAVLIDKIFSIMPSSFKLRYLYYTPRSYARFALASVGSDRLKGLQNIGIIKMAIDPQVIYEPTDWAYNRFMKDGITDIPVSRVASLLIHLKKSP